MRYSVIVEFTRKMEREYDNSDDEGYLIVPTDDDEFTESEIEDNKPDFEFPGLDYSQFDDGTGCGFGSYDFAGVLGEKAMQELMRKLCLEVTEDKTMGTIGAPGCGLGMVPNILCRGCEDDSGSVEAFITPIPTKREMKKLNWNDAKKRLAALAA